MPSSVASTLLGALALSAVAGASVLPRNNGNGKGNNANAAYYYDGRGSDPDFTISPLELNSVLSCVGGVENAKKPFLLVPGST